MKKFSAAYWRWLLLAGGLASLSIGTYNFGYRRGYQYSLENQSAYFQENEESKLASTTEPVDVDEHQQVPSIVHIRKEAKRFNDRGIEYRKLIRHQVIGSETLYSTGDLGGSGEEKVTLGLAVLSGVPKSLSGDLRPLFQCADRRPAQRETEYYSASANCGGGEPVGKRTKLSVFTRLVDSTFVPMYLCKRDAEGQRYLSLNRLCEAESDHIEEVVGYVKASGILLE